MVAGERRLDVELVHRGLARSRTRAGEMIASGAVLVGGREARRPAQQVGDGTVVEVVSPHRDDVSRGATKLRGALADLADLDPAGLTVAGRTCLDAGASTGGFTQVLLEAGARHVCAVDVGHGQMAPELVREPRVQLHEGLNVRDLTADHLPGPPDLVVADLSFISLTLLVPRLIEVAAPGADLLVMVKPQFEVGRARLGRGGVVSSPELRTDSVMAVVAAAARAGAVCRAVVPSRLPGERGNREYFLWLHRGSPDARTAAPLDDGSAAEPAVTTAVRDDRPCLVRWSS